MYKRISILFFALLFVLIGVSSAQEEPRTLFISDIIDIAPIDPATYSHTIGRTMIRNVLGLSLGEEKSISWKA